MADAINGTVHLYWEECGDPTAPPLLLVMGHIFGARMWHRNVPALAEHFRVLSFDNRGVGRSDAPKGSYSIEMMARDALAVLDAAGVQRAHVYGVSMGGIIAQELAFIAPDRVAGLVLGCTGAPGEHNRPAPRRGQFLAYWLPRRMLVAGSRSTGYGSAVPQAAKDDDAKILLATPVSKRGLIAQAKAIAAYHSFERVASITAPTLVLHGDEDVVVPMERGEELAALIPGARLEIFKGAGHNFAAGCPEHANQVVIDFLSGIPITSGGDVATR